MKAIAKIFSIFVLLVVCNANASVISKWNVYSNILQEQRTVFVHVPSSFDQNTRYKIAYTFDGKENGTNYHRLLVESGQGQLAEQLIVIATENKERGLDFTPPYEAFGKDKKTKGRADQFLNFIEKELILKVESTYNTTESRTIIEHSWSAAFATYVLSTTPSLFNEYLIFSPTVIYRPTVEESTQRLFDDLNRNLFDTKRKLPSIFITVGEKEPEKYSAPYYKITEFLDSKSMRGNRYGKLEIEGAGHFDTLGKSISQGFNFVVSD